ncbi:serine hydrolase domain-containing protein [Daejeonella sp.]|uniref:serine hydrolase domain-containing protein n=1 Tax=Daejeonella sp. TaxID=2805397 RepID=UPI0039834006
MRKILILVCVFAIYTVKAQDQGNSASWNATENSTVLLNNSKGVIPLKNVSKLKIASVDLGYGSSAVFDSIARKYWNITSFRADIINSPAELNVLHMKLKFFDTVILKLSDRSYFNQALMGFLADLEKQSNVVLVFSGMGSELAKLEKLKSPIIWNKWQTNESASVSAQVLFGGVEAKGKLDTNYSTVFKKGTGFETKKIRLGYSSPEAVALNNNFTAGIDAIVKEGIAAYSAPSAVILVAKEGKVIFNKAYGSHTYGGASPARLDDIYDLASVTKVTATTPSIMRLYDRKIIGLDTLISKYVATTRNIPDKKDIKIKEALLHEAGFYPYIKFFELLKPGDMSRDSSDAHPVKVADGYFLRANYFEDVIWPVTLNSHGGTRGKFVYSDVSMYMLKEVIEQVTHRRLNEYVLNEFYLPLGMQSTGYLPRNRFEKSRIVPTTENDNWFRNMLVQGYVNDPGAAMAGGVQGHAGLFANANDLAIYYQMLLNKGIYGGEKFFDPATVDLFTSQQSKVSPRGYGFARMTDAEQKADKGYPSELAYGHSGYTGTYVWVDPMYNLVYICLTNRVYPDDNKTYGVSKVNLRARVLDYVYEELLKAQRK